MRLLAIAITLLFAAAAQAGPTPAVRGLANHVDVEYAPRLKARSDQSPASPILVRVSPLEGNGGAARQRVEFIGAVAGDFDLKNYLEREDGRSLDDLPSIPVSVASRLPADHGTDLFGSGESWFNWRAHYRTLLWSAIGLWLAVPVIWLIVRAMRKPKAVAPAPIESGPPTIEEELLAALAAAKAREPSVEDRARLELLVFRYFGQRLGTDATPDDPAHTIRTLRDHAQTRDLVAAIERWLHARGGAESGREHAAQALERLRLSRLDGAPSQGVTA